LAEPETLRRVRLNARQHASRQDWEGTIALFESYLHSATQPASTAALAAKA
jgi:hypothetical protein